MPTRPSAASASWRILAEPATSTCSLLPFSSPLGSCVLLLLPVFSSQEGSFVHPHNHEAGAVSHPRPDTGSGVQEKFKLMVTEQQGQAGHRAGLLAPSHAPRHHRTGQLRAPANMRLMSGFFCFFRPSKHSVGSERRYSREGGAALAKAFRRHLPFLEALSQAPASDTLARTRMAQDRPRAEVTLPLPPRAGAGFSSRVWVPGRVSSQLHACVPGQWAACEQGFSVPGAP